VLPLVGISLSVTADTKVDYRYEVRNHESVADTLDYKGNENWYKVSSGEPTSFRKKNLEDGKIITDFENKMLTVIFYDKDGQQCKTRFVDVDPNEDIYIHNGAYANESVFNKVAAEEPESVGATKINLQHEHRHNHYSYTASWSMVNDTAKKLIIGLAISTLVLTATLVAVLVHFTNSEMYLGKKYMELYQSDLLTKSIVDDRELEKIVKGKYSVKEKVGF